MGKEKQKPGKDDKKPKDNVKKKGKKEDKVNKKKKAKKKTTKKSKKDTVKKSKSSAAMKPQTTKISHEERLEMIRTAAYYLAQKRSYSGESELDDWLTAEKEIEEMIREGED